MAASWSGWLAALIIVMAATIPLIARQQRGKRAAPDSPPIRLHVTVGLAVAAVSAIHTLLAILNLGAPEVIAAGDIPLAIGALAFLVLLAHTGLGLQLRNPKLRHRRQIRRQHWLTASILVVAVTLHAWFLFTAT